MCALGSLRSKRVRLSMLWPLLPIRNTLSSLPSLKLCKTHPHGANTKRMAKNVHIRADGQHSERHLFSSRQARAPLQTTETSKPQCAGHTQTLICHSSKGALFSFGGRGAPMHLRESILQQPCPLPDKLVLCTRVHQDVRVAYMSGATSKGQAAHSPACQFLATP